MKEKVCPCGSKAPYAECCLPFIDGSKLAEEPQVLMRSRYTAFCVNAIKYLQDTWHPETLPEDLGNDEPNNWVSLEIIEFDHDEEEGEVEFKASLIYDDKLETLHERSLFLFEQGKWLYHSGEFLNDGGHVRKLKKGEPCPCDSGKSFKNCHLKKN